MSDIPPDLAFNTIVLRVTEEAWTPVGTADDERSKLMVVVMINGKRHFLEAYEVTEYGSAGCPHCGEGINQEHPKHPDLCARYELIALAHDIPRQEMVTIDRRTYVLYAAPATR